eukprot:CAMPEP_0197635370 /NCGR_PEP_ID=MMETSP1338-20131121/11209_1 /TAXON_ID=43686 ORGANISM="Pelagodinium beii, Strain RCC1491" /NCGR_SAMPLE_ID=MMETSP1338 /ASSEMBLY_ACC=CAM_ASM_000754 /LENGTH=47 /DNA_ID= /DNA_START= /DNA_END= /DNA_ORIENTATION=
MVPPSGMIRLFLTCFQAAVSKKGVSVRNPGALEMNVDSLVDWDYLTA